MSMADTMTSLVSSPWLDTDGTPYLRDAGFPCSGRNATSIGPPSPATHTQST
jgi:hypothetical protein